MCEECGADITGNPWSRHYGNCSYALDDADSATDMAREESAHEA